MRHLLTNCDDFRVTLDYGRRDGLHLISDSVDAVRSFTGDAAHRHFRQPLLFILVLLLGCFVLISAVLVIAMFVSIIASAFAKPPSKKQDWATLPVSAVTQLTLKCWTPGCTVYHFEHSFRNWRQHQQLLQPIALRHCFASCECCNRKMPAVCTVCVMRVINCVMPISHLPLSLWYVRAE